MILFVGLGNPGEKYEKTPHNVGFRALDKLRNFLGYTPTYDVGDWEFDKYCEAFLCTGKTHLTTKFVLAKPITFMNQSGRSVQELIKKYGINIEKELIIFYDDLDIKLGSYKIARGKAPKGHNGLMSVFRHVKTLDFLTVRIGIDNRQNRDIPGEEYVLKAFTEEELQILDETIAEAVKNLRFNITL
jgi:peptidyl-tRNA hydrolase, PTH1 family